MKNWNKRRKQNREKIQKSWSWKRAGIQECVLLALFHHNPGILLITWLFYKQRLTILSEGRDNSGTCPFLVLKGTPPHIRSGAPSLERLSRRTRIFPGQSFPQKKPLLEAGGLTKPTWEKSVPSDMLITQNKILSECSKYLVDPHI